MDGWASSKGVVLDLQLSGTWTTEPHSNLERGEWPWILGSVELGPLSPAKTWKEESGPGTWSHWNFGPLRLSLTQPEIWKLEEKSGTGIWTQWNLDH